jgi:hypothetical protein
VTVSYSDAGTIAASATSAALIVVIHPIGRGTTHALSGLYRRGCSFRAVS